MFIYILAFIGIVIYGIKTDIKNYKEGKYSPNIFKKREDNLSFGKRFLITFLLIVGPSVFFSDDEKYIAIIMFIIALSILIIHASRLNYLTYNKSGEKTIIAQTIIHILIKKY